VFPVAALALYCRWAGGLSWRRVVLLALLCCIGLFSKHSLIAVPIALAIILFLRERHFFWRFAVSGVLISVVMLLGCRLYGGPAFFQNFINFNFVDFNRFSSTARMLQAIERLLFRQWVALMLLPVGIVIAARKREYTPALVYLTVGFLIGCYAFRGAGGVDGNLWFDFYLGLAICFGLALAAAATRNRLRELALVYGTLLVALAPLYMDGGRTALRLDYSLLKQNEERYRSAVNLLKSFSDPVLYEEPLLGFDASKPYEFETFTGSQMMLSGRVPEQLLLDPIERRQYSAIVLNFEIEKRSRSRNVVLGPPVPRVSKTVQERWTDNTLRAILANYRLLDGGQADLYYFYIPRATP
jgi:hypothetical protein